MKRLVLFLVLLGRAVVPGSAFGASGAYDFVADFGRADSANPPGPWSYLHTVNTWSTDPADLVPFPTQFPVDGLGNAWTTAGPEGEIRFPLIFANSTTGTLHPANDGLAVLGWAAPFTGTAQVAGVAGDSDTRCGNGVSWSLNRERQVLAGGRIENGGLSQPVLAPDLAVAAGETLYLVVDPIGEFSCDSTVLDLKIALTNDDADNDGVADATDTCPSVSNPGQENRDGTADTQGDACDTDADNDGIGDLGDNCRDVPNPDQANTGVAPDDLGDACDDDADNDAVVDSRDNCPNVANISQADLDADRVGDACDGDRDGDGVADAQDNAPDTPNADQQDLDGDGIGDVIDPKVLPASASQCKKDGWMRFHDGSSRFKNQGDCVSFVATGAKNLPAGR